MLTDLKGFNGIESWESTFSLRFEGPCTLGEDEIRIPQHLLNVSFESGECASRIASSLASLNWNARIWLGHEEEVTLDWFDDRHSHLILVVPNLFQASHQGIGHIRKLWAAAETETVARLASAQQLEWLHLSRSGLGDPEVLYALQSVIDLLERLESLTLELSDGLVQARGHDEIRELLRTLAPTLPPG